MIADLIVFASAIFALAFFAAWLTRPGMRALIERPKYRFQENVKNYDSIRSSRR